MLKIKILLLFVYLSSFPRECFSDDCCLGIVMLDQFTFDKVSSKFHYSFIKFDHPFPIGLDHDAFVSLGRQLFSSDNNDILIANIEIDSNNDQHQELIERYKLDTNEFPALKLFLNHNYRNTTIKQFKKLRPINYPIERDYNLDSRIVLNPITMRLFLWTQINVRTPLPNCTQELDDLAEEYVYLLEQGQQESNPKLLQAIQEHVDEIYSKTKQQWIKYSASIYAKLMLKSMKQGLPFFDYEHIRVKKLLNDQYQITDNRRKKLAVHFNILQSFRLRNYETMLKENENARVRNYNPTRIEL